MIIKRLATVGTLTAFVSAISTPAIAQQHHGHPAAHPATAHPAAAHPAAGHPAAARPAHAHGHGHGQTQTASGASASPAPTASGSPAPAAVDPSIAEARQEYEAGRTAIQANHADEALRHFQRAYELRSNPVVLLPIEQAQEALGHIPDAIATYEHYLHDRADAPDRAAVEQRLDALRHRPATLHVTSNPAGAHILVDGHDTGHVTPSDVTADPGHRVIRLELAGYAPSNQELEAGPGASSDVTAPLEAQGAGPSSDIIIAETQHPASGAPAAAVPAATNGSHAPGPVVWVAAVVALGGLVAGSVFGFMALSDHADYTAMPRQDTLMRGETNAVLSDIFFGVAILAAAVGIVVWVAGDDEHPAHASLRHTPRRGPRVGVLPNGLMLNF